MPPRRCLVRLLLLLACDSQTRWETEIDFYRSYACQDPCCASSIDEAPKMLIGLEGAHAFNVSIFCRGEHLLGSGQSRLNAPELKKSTPAEADAFATYTIQPSSRAF
jgi:hypothetical protein